MVGCQNYCCCALQGIYGSAISGNARHTGRPRPDEVSDQLQDRQDHRPTDQATVYQRDHVSQIVRLQALTTLLALMREVRGRRIMPVD